MMTPQQLLYAVVSAHNTTEVQEALEDYAADMGLRSYKDLPYRQFGDQAANARSVEAMGDVGNAAYEKITNMHDGVISLLQRQKWFKSDPKTATEALDEIAERQKEGVPGVYLMTATSKPRKGESPKKTPRANLSFIDEGIGMEPERMPHTILSLTGSNKLKNDLMAGCYGHGGSAIHSFSKFALVLSRSHSDPNTIGFTIVRKGYPEGARTASYMYLTGDDGEVLRFDAGTLDSTQFIHPNDLDGSRGEESMKAYNAKMIELIENKLILPDHGTVVKVWDLETSPFTVPSDTYHFLRDRGFSLKVPTRVRVGTRTRDDKDHVGGIRRKQNVVGMKGVLTGESQKGGGRKNFHNLAEKHDRQQVFDGQADIHCWVRDFTEEGRKSKEKQAGMSIIHRITGLKHREKSPIYVTLNGMTHGNIHSATLLRKANLPYLTPHMVMEIDCDAMNVRKKGSVFVSTRESLNSAAVEELREDIQRWLDKEASNPASPLRRANDELARRSNSGQSKTPEADQYDELYRKFMKTSSIGKIITGMTSSQSLSRYGDGDFIDDGNESGEGRKERQIANGAQTAEALKSKPTMIRVSKKTIQKGEKEFINVRTDATNDWSDRISIEVPDFLERLNEPELDNGMISYLVRATGEIGEKDSIMVQIDVDDGGNLEDSCEIAIIGAIEKKEGTTPKLGGGGKKVPEVKIIETSPKMENWDQMEAGSIPPEKVAMNYKVVGNEIHIMWNTDFGGVRGVGEHITKKYSEEARDKIILDAQMHARFLANTHILSKEDEVTDSVKTMWGQSIAATILVGTMNMTNEISQSLKAQKRDRTKKQAA